MKTIKKLLRIFDRKYSKTEDIFKQNSEKFLKSQKSFQKIQKGCWKIQKNLEKSTV